MIAVLIRSDKRGRGKEAEKNKPECNVSNFGFHDLVRVVDAITKIKEQLNAVLVKKIRIALQMKSIEANERKKAHMELNWLPLVAL